MKYLEIFFKKLDFSLISVTSSMSKLILDSKKCNPRAMRGKGNNCVIRAYYEICGGSIGTNRPEMYGFVQVRVSGKVPEAVSQSALIFSSCCLARAASLESGNLSMRVLKKNFAPSGLPILTRERPCFR